MISLCILAVTLGLLYQTRRLCSSWTELLIIFGVSAVPAFILLLSIGFSEDGLMAALVLFLAAFAMCSVAANYKKLKPQLHEGITMVQCLSIIYWAIENNTALLPFFILVPVGVISGAFILFSLFHAFASVNLSKTSRMILSIGSSVVVMIFGIDNVYQTIQHTDFRHSDTETWIIFLRYFILGIVCIHIVYNFFSILGSPDSSYYGAIGFHTDRFTDKQFHAVHSFICLIIALAVFIPNYLYNFLPPTLAIWVVFIVLPIVIGTIDIRTRNGY